MEEYDVLVGTLGSRIEENCWSDPSTNKIGGYPDWLNGHHKAACKNCGRALTLVCQLSCPLDKVYKRTLYLLTCININCIKKNEWHILRSMCLIKKINQEIEPLSDDKEDDWGMSNINEVHEISQSPESNLNSLSFDMSLNLVECKEELENQMWINLMKKHSKNNTSSKNNIFCPQQSKIAFECYYIESNFEEEYQCLSEDAPNYNENTINSSPTNLTLPENYEKCVPPHKDIQFYKFYKRIQNCPQQCLRYSRRGRPLVVQDLNFSFPPCEFCGSPRIFEFQLMPQILTFLKLDSPSPASHPLDFFSILIYTCSSNCWDKDKDTYKEEYAIALPSI